MQKSPEMYSQCPSSFDISNSSTTPRITILADWSDVFDTLKKTTMLFFFYNFMLVL